jgi:homogentisate 1,2-dioxygenase
LANPRDFQAPVAAFEDTAGAYEVIKKFGGHFWRAPMAQCRRSCRRRAR